MLRTWRGRKLVEAEADIDGALVGGACLDATDFAAIASAAQAIAAKG